MLTSMYPMKPKVQGQKLVPGQTAAYKPPQQQASAPLAPKPMAPTVQMPQNPFVARQQYQPAQNDYGASTLQNQVGQTMNRLLSGENQAGDQSNRMAMTQLNNMQKGQNQQTARQAAALGFDPNGPEAAGLQQRNNANLISQGSNILATQAQKNLEDQRQNLNSAMSFAQNITGNNRADRAMGESQFQFDANRQDQSGARAEDTRRWDITNYQSEDQRGIDNTRNASRDTRSDFEWDTNRSDNLGQRSFDNAFREKEFGANQSQRAEDNSFRRDQFGENTRQFDVTRGDNLAQRTEDNSFRRDQFGENTRQFDVTRADTLNQRNFDNTRTTARDTRSDFEWDKTFDANQGQQSFDNAFREKEFGANQSQRWEDNSFRNRAFDADQTQRGVDNNFRDRSFDADQSQRGFENNRLLGRDAQSDSQWNQEFGAKESQRGQDNAFRDRTFDRGTYEWDTTRKDNLDQRSLDNAFAADDRKDRAAQAILNDPNASAAQIAAAKNYMGGRFGQNTGDQNSGWNQRDTSDAENAINDEISWGLASLGVQQGQDGKYYNSSGSEVSNGAIEAIKSQARSRVGSLRDLGAQATATTAGVEGFSLAPQKSLAELEALVNPSTAPVKKPTRRTEDNNQPGDRR